MPWRDKLKDLKSELERIVKPQQEQHQQQQQHQPPPPPPGPSPDFHIYWCPRFYPDTPISAEWDAKLGNGHNGWGNQELEHYTAAPENSFQ